MSTNHTTVHVEADAFTDGLICRQLAGRVSVRFIGDGGIHLWVTGDAKAWAQFNRDALRLVGVVIDAFQNRPESEEGQ